MNRHDLTATAGARCIQIPRWASMQVAHFFHKNTDKILKLLFPRGSRPSSILISPLASRWTHSRIGETICQSETKPGKDMDSTPPTLLEQLRSSDSKQAWDQFHELYGQRIWAKTNRRPWDMFPPPGDWSQDGHQFAADVCQETVIKVFLNLRHFVHKGAGSFRAWLDTIVRNEIVNQLRKPGGGPAGWSQKNIDDLCSQLADARQDFHVFTKDEHDRHLVGIALAWLQKEFADPIRRVDLFPAAAGAGMTSPRKSPTRPA